MTRGETDGTGRRGRVQLGAGQFEVDIPKMTGALLPLRSEVLPAFKRRSALYRK